MLKKIVALMITVFMLMTGIEAFAANAGSGSPTDTQTTDTQTADSQTAGSQTTDNTGSGSQGMKERAAEIKQCTDMIRANNAELVRLRKQVQTVSEQLRIKVKAMVENKEKLTTEQVEQVKQAVKNINGCGQQIRETIGNVANECLMFRKAARQGKADDAIAALNRVMTVQAARIQNMNQAIAEMEAVLEL